jgi:predicted  nucleic acid-binding Zn-ribbon protein
VSGVATAALERVLLAAYKTTAERQRAIAAQTERVREELEKHEASLTRQVADVAARSDTLRGVVDALATEASALSTELLGGIAPDFEQRWKQFEQRADAAERQAEGLRNEKNQLKAELDDTLASFDRWIDRNPQLAPIFS